MTKICPVCEVIFKDGDDLVAVVRAKYKELPSRVTYALALPTEVFEMNHYDCAKGDLIPWCDDEDDALSDE